MPGQRRRRNNRNRNRINRYTKKSSGTQTMMKRKAPLALKQHQFCERTIGDTIQIGNEAGQGAAPYFTKAFKLADTYNQKDAAFMSTLGFKPIYRINKNSYSRLKLMQSIKNI